MSGSKSFSLKRNFIKFKGRNCHFKPLRIATLSSFGSDKVSYRMVNEAGPVVFAFVYEQFLFLTRH